MKRSRSLSGATSRRPRPPQPISATSTDWSSNEASHSSTRAAWARPNAGPRSSLSSISCRRHSAKRWGSTLLRPNPHDLFDRDDPYFPVTDLARLRGMDDSFDHLVQFALLDQDLELRLRHEVYSVLRAPIHLRVAALTAVATRLRQGHA